MKLGPVATTSLVGDATVDLVGTGLLDLANNLVRVLLKFGASPVATTI